MTQFTPRKYFEPRGDILLKLPISLLRQIDEITNKKGMSRTEYLNIIISEGIKNKEAERQTTTTTS